MLAYITPLVSNLLLIIWAVMAFLFFILTKNKKKWRITAFIFMAGFWLISTRIVTESIIMPLEKAYSVPSIAYLKKTGIKKIVVLTGGGYPRNGELITSAFPHGSAYRFWSAIELASKLGPAYELIFSGSAGRSNRQRATAKLMADLAKKLLPGRKIDFEAKSGSTAEHGDNIRKFTGDKPFILITSAYHTKRAVNSIKKKGLKPLPYPVDFLALGHYGWEDFLPSSEALWTLHAGFREYLAICLYSVKGW